MPPKKKTKIYTKLPSLMPPPRRQEAPPPDRDKSPDDEMDEVVMEVLDKIECAKHQRKQMEIAHHLNEIQERVMKALEYGGLLPTLKATQSELEREKAKARPPTFDIKEKRKKLLYQRHLLMMISDFMCNSDEQQKLMGEVDTWFMNFSDMEADILSEDDLMAKDKSLRESDINIRQAFQYAQLACEKLKEVGSNMSKVLKHTAGEEAARRRRGSQNADSNVGSSQKMSDHDKQTLFTDEHMVADYPTFEMALNDIKVLLEQNIRWVRTNQQKVALRGGVKQQKFIMQAVETRTAEVEKLKQDVQELQTKMEDLTTANDKLQEESESQHDEIRTLENKILTVNMQVHELETSNQSLLEEMSGLEERLAQKERAVSAVMLTKRVSSRVLGPRQSMVNQLESDLTSCRSQLEAEIMKSNQLEFELQAEQERAAHLEAKLEISSQMREEENDLGGRVKEEMTFKLQTLTSQHESLERQVARLKSELNCKDELIAYQERRLMEMKEEMGMFSFDDVINEDKIIIPAQDTNIKMSSDAKRLLGRIQKDLQKEINRLKCFLEREKQRGEAAVRRVEQAHKEQLANVHKQSLHLLRAINRFKGSVVQILERENLQAAAHDVKCVPDLPTEEAPSDTRLLLAQMAGNAVELLVSMEFKLSQALMNKRLEVKDNTIARTFATKDLETQIGYAFKAKQQADVLTEKLRETKEQLDTANENMKDVRKEEGDRYQALAEKYQLLRTNYNALQKEMSALQKDFGETVKNKEKNLKLMINHKRVLVKSLEESQGVVDRMKEHLQQRRVEKEMSYQLSLTDQKYNLFMLAQLFSKDYISKDMYVMTASLVHQMAELPDIRLQRFFRRYIAFRRLQEAKEHIHAAMDSHHMISHKTALQEFLDRSEENLAKRASIWQADCEQLEVQRKQIFNRLTNMLNDCVDEAVIMMPTSNFRMPSLTDPQDSPAERKSSSAGSSASRTEREFPEALVGQQMPILGGQEKMWHLPSIPLPVPRDAINTPLLLELDINQQQLVAQRALKRSNRASYPLTQVEGFDYQENVLRPLREMMKMPPSHNDVDIPPQRASTPTKLLRKKSEALPFYVN